MKRPLAEQFLDTLNRAVELGEGRMASDLSEAAASVKEPVLLVVGAPRSGTTVLLQWLSSSDRISAPTNLLARFHRNPYIGGLIQRLLTDPNLGYLDELALGSTGSRYSSTIGKTSGILAPHEFSYFWRDYFPVGLPEHLSEEDWVSSDLMGFLDALGRLQLSLSTAVALKGIILQYNLRELSELVKRAVILVCQRDEVDNVESLLEARRVASSESEWFSVRPPGWEFTLDFPALSQVCAQVAWTNDDLRAQCAEIPENRVVWVENEDLCHIPHEIWGRVRLAAQVYGYSLPSQEPEIDIRYHARHSDRRREIEQELSRMRAERPII